MSRPYLSVIIPARNEAQRLPLTLIDIDRHLSEAGFPYEIIVADNNSTDSTPEIVERFSQLIPNLKLLRVEAVGKGGTVKAAMLEAQGEYRLFTDADNSTSIDQFLKMQVYLKQGYDVVIGSRVIKGAKMAPPQGILKRVMGKMGNLFIQLMVLPGFWDTQCGFKVFSEAAVKKIFPIQRISGWGFDIELLALAKRFSFRIKEIPVIWVNDPHSKVGIMGYFTTLLDTVKIRWWLWRNAYGLKG
ncbi:MAG: glycosyltransferase family 2 protein [Candidatus Colwellbacteria bacterium]|nr:glycosyltransferase family 2 protein [Candidatus Colwellbacteria bacterium]